MSLYNYEAEQSVLGACLLKNELIDSMADIISAADFHDYRHAQVWAAILNAYRTGPADVVTVADGLPDLQGGVSFIASLTQSAPSLDNAAVYAGIVKDKAQRRELLTRLRAIEEDAEHGSNVADIVDTAQGHLQGILGHTGKGATLLLDSIRQVVDTIDKKHNGDVSPMGETFGLSDLDHLTMGMKGGELIVVGARPSMGKTAFAINITRAVAKEKPTIIFSMEMGHEAITTRMLAAESDLHIEKLRNPAVMESHDWDMLTMGTQALKGARLVIDDRASLTPSQIRGASKRWKHHFGELGLVVVDYLGLMKPEGDHGTREQEVAHASRNMKALAKELDCPVVLLSQLNRNLESRTDRRPRMSDLRESGSVEQDADLILFLYRHEVYEPDDEKYKGIGEIIIGKQREGRLGTVYTAARLAHARFDNLDTAAIARLKEPAPAPQRKQKSAMADF